MRKVYTIECDRCGTPVSYKSRSGYRNAKKRHENGAFLCKKCKGKSTAPNLIFTSKTTAVIVCPKCERAKELHGRWHINDYIKRYGRDCEGYVCPECRKAPPLGDKVCSVCGKHKPHLNSESKRKFLKRYENRLYICSECRKKRTEESHVLTCRKCGEKRVLKTQREISYWRYWAKSGKSYVCEKCRKIDSGYSVQKKLGTVKFVSTKEYKELLDECLRAKSVAVSQGLTDSAIEQFLSSVSELLEKKFIYDYDINIVDGKMIGIYLHKVSVYGEVYLPFENTTKAFGRRGVPS